LNACLETQQIFVVDNTNPKIEDRNGNIDAGKEAAFPPVMCIANCLVSRRQ
jgi:hypothetical protein